MPTLIQVEVSIEEEVSDASETILYDESTLLFEESADEEDDHRLCTTENEGVENMKLPQSPHFSQEEVLQNETAELPLSERNRAVDQSNTQSSTSIQERRNQTSNRTSEELSPCFAPIAVKDSSYRSGPNRTLYESTHKSNVKQAIRRFDLEHPGTLVDYRLLSIEEKQEKQRCVLALLARLGIGQENTSRKLIEESPACAFTKKRTTTTDRQRLLDETLSPIMPDATKYDSESIENDHSCAFPLDHSASLLQQSPSLLIDHSQQQQEGASINLPLSPTSSVELARAANDDSSSRDNYLYDSPALSLRILSSKRHASSSAKRGEDVARFRYSRDDLGSQQHVGTSKAAGAAEIELSGQRDLFLASQSPISPRMTYDSSSSDGELEREPSKPFDQFSDGCDMNTQPPFSSDDTIRTFSSSVPQRHAASERPLGIGLRDGAVFHVDKLKVKRSEKIRSAKGGMKHRIVEFPDPFVRYNRGQQEVLNDVCKSICRSELDSVGQSETRTATALFSMTIRQITDMCLKLLLNDDSIQTRNGRKGDSPLIGKTLIVVRTKEDTAAWEKELRECTGCSVFNHATIPLSERIRLTTAKKASLFDVTLTTYDALKSTDVAVALDNLDRAILKSTESESGWHSSRLASTQSEAGASKRCKKFSVLHKINFERTVFLDVLGRKSYLAKDGTARASAALALRGNSR